MTGDKHYCPGFYDQHGIWNNGFYCPMWGTQETKYCCGVETSRYCCQKPQERESSGAVDNQIPLIAGVSIGAVLLIVLVVLCFLYPGCPLYKKRKKRHERDTAHRCQGCQHATQAPLIGGTTEMSCLSGSCSTQQCNQQCRSQVWNGSLQCGVCQTHGTRWQQGVPELVPPEDPPPYMSEEELESRCSPKTVSSLDNLSTDTRCSHEDENSRLPLFEALDSLTWPRVQNPRSCRTASVSSTGAVIDVVTTSSGSERDTGIIGNYPDPASYPDQYPEQGQRTLSRSSAPRSMPQSPDLIICSDHTASTASRKTYLPHLPETQSTFKPIFHEQKRPHLDLQQQHIQYDTDPQQQQQQQQLQKQLHKRQQAKHRKSDIQEVQSVSGSDPEDAEPDLPVPMQSTSISRLSPMITSVQQTTIPLNPPKRQSLASMYANKKSTYHKDRSLSPLSERNRPLSPRRKHSEEPVSPSSVDSSSPEPPPSWSSQVDEAFRRLQQTKQTDLDVLKTSMV